MHIILHELIITILNISLVLSEAKALHIHYLEVILVLALEDGSVLIDPSLGEGGRE